MSRIFWMLLFVGALSPEPRAWAAFEDTGTGARPTALGGTYVVLGDDALSLMVNPAGLAQLRRSELTSEYSKLYAGLSDNSNISQTYVGYGQPIPYGGAVAFGWKQLSLSGLYSERTLSLGYGRWITPRLAAGMAFKQLHHSFSAPDTIVDNSGQIQSGTPLLFTQNGTSAGAFSGDAGILYRLTDRQMLGWSIQDFNQPNVALSGSDYDPVTPTTRLGWDYQDDHHLSLAGALVTRENLSHERDYQWVGASEKWWYVPELGEVGARGSMALGSRDYRQMATGFGWGIHPLELDYAFVFNFSGIKPGQTAGTHRFSVAYRFGARKKSETPLIFLKRPAASETNEKTLTELLTEVPVAPAPVCPSSSTTSEPATSTLAGMLKQVAAHLESKPQLPQLELVMSDMRTYFRCSNQELIDNEADLYDLDKASETLVSMRAQNISFEKRKKFLIETVESSLESALKHRPKDPEDAREKLYRSWLRRAYPLEHGRMTRRAPLQARITFLLKVSREAANFER